METKKDNLKNLITNDIVRLTNSIEPVQNTTDDILQKLSESIGQIDFTLLAFPDSAEVLAKFKALENKLNSNGGLSDDDQILFSELGKKLEKYKLTKNHYLILCIEQLLKIAKANNWGLCKKNGYIYLYNGSYWTEIDKENFQSFLGNVALQMGVEKFKCKIHTFKDELFKQFMADAYLPTPAQVVRFRLLNASSERILNIGLQGNLSFYQIATDGKI